MHANTIHKPENVLLFVPNLIGVFSFCSSVDVNLKASALINSLTKG